MCPVLFDSQNGRPYFTSAKVETKDIVAYIDEMDRFYLENIGLYIKLISAIDPEQPAPHFSRHEAAPLNDEVTEKQWHLTTVVAARVRPLLEEDLAAGFPLAVYPRRALKDGAEIIDVHDLYNHPKGRPIIKVLNNSYSL